MMFAARGKYPKTHVSALMPRPEMRRDGIRQVPQRLPLSGRICLNPYSVESWGMESTHPELGLHFQYIPLKYSGFIF